MTARKVLPVCQMWPTSGHLRRDLLGCLVVKRQMVNSHHPANWDAAQVPGYTLPRLLKEPKGILVSVTLIFKDPNQVHTKVKAGASIVLWWVWSQHPGLLAYGA